MRPEQSVYLSAWIRTDRTDTLGGTVASMGDNYGVRIQPGGEALFSVAKADGSWARIKSIESGLKDGRWHHLACQLGRNGLEIHVDGKLNVREAYPGRIAYPFGSRFYVGAHGNGKSSFDFLGNIDEVRVSSQGRSADWIRLVYESERPDSGLLQFE